MHRIVISTYFLILLLISDFYVSQDCSATVADLESALAHALIENGRLCVVYYLFPDYTPTLKPCVKNIEQSFTEVYSIKFCFSQFLNLDSLHVFNPWWQCNFNCRNMNMNFRNLVAYLSITSIRNGWSFLKQSVAKMRFITLCGKKNCTL